MDNKKEDKGFYFWRNVDVARGELTIKEIAKRAGISYQLMKAQRSDNTLPRVDNACSIANAINTTCEFLVSGKFSQSSKYYDYLQSIMALEKEDPEKLRVVRELLGINKGGSSSNSGTRVG